jgi:hypothetical protein
MFMKQLSRIFFYLGIIGTSFLASCEPADSDVLGCVTGKIKGDNFAISLGCMSRVEFERYLEYPYQTYNGKTINRDLTFRKVEDCIKCQ